jgi:choline dehydrogenase-like flavoprotein
MPDAAEFEPRPGVCEHGWPVPFNEIVPHVEAVLRTYSLPALPLPPGRTHGGAELEARLALSFGCAQVPAEDFARKHEAILSTVANVTAVLGAHATELLPAPGGAMVGEVAVRGLEPGRSGRIAAETVIVAAGAIETPRLLLNSTRFGGQGPGNRHGHLGCGIMDHLRVRAGRFIPTKQALSDGLLGSSGLERQRVFTRLGLPAARQHELGLCNHSLSLKPGEDPGVMKRLFSTPGPCEAWFWIEPCGSPQNRVTLDAERDELGMPIASVKWDITERDVGDLQRFAGAMRETLAADHGTLEVDPLCFDPNLWLACGQVAGTTRMAAIAEHGVVDPDGRVFGVQNLYVAGSSVFPVAGGSEPMLLSLALARRLARHLSE